jgi:hypothetical protein
VELNIINQKLRRKMMINETKEKMVQMKFKGMLKAFEEQ